MVKIIYHWHSFLEIDFLRWIILIDPFIKKDSIFFENLLFDSPYFTDNIYCDVTLEEIIKKDIKCILVSHLHYDHVGNAIDISSQTSAPIISTIENIFILKNFSVRIGKNIICEPLHIGWEIKISDYLIKLTPAIHWWSWHWYACGFLIKIWGKIIYYSGDTALTYEMKLLWELYDIDVAILPVDGRFNMSVEDSIKAIEFLAPKIFIPVHINTWDIIRLDKTIKEYYKKVKNTRVIFLSPWDSISL